MWWNDEIKGEVERKEAAWKEVLGAKHETTKERCMAAQKKERKNVVRCIYHTKKGSE